MASIVQTANPAGVTATSNVATYSSVSIGVAALNRIVVVAVATELASSTPSGCTIDYGSGDVAMTAASGGNLGAVYSQLYYLKVPTGTTATIKVTYSATNPTNLQNHIAVYRVLGVKYSSSGNDGSTDMDATDPLTTGSITIPSGGVFIAVAGGATDGTGKTWANATEDIDADAGSLRFTTAIRDTALTTTAVTCTGGTNGEDGALSYIIFEADVAPTVALNSPADASSGSDTTPTLDFTATDTESNDVTYQLQIDTVNTFDSQSPSVEVGNVTAGSASTGAGPFTVSHNNNKEDVYVFVSVRDDANNTLSVKYGGVDMTSIGNHTVTGGSVLEAQIFYLANAPIGANEVLVTTSGSIAEVLGFGAISTKNAAQTSPVEATTTGGETPGVEDPRSTSVTTLTTNGLVIDAISDRSAGLTVGGSSTQIFKLGSGDNMAASYRLPTSTGAYAMEWDPTENTEDWAQVVLAIKKAGRPLLSKFSHLDSGFANPDVGGDTDPFTSGDNIQFTVQAGDALAADTYYWRVRAIDPSGSGVYGAWSSTRSFDVTAGGAVYEQDCNEVITLVDVIRKFESRPLSDVFTLVDVVRKKPTRILTEVVSLVDTVRKLPNKLQTDVVTLVDTFSRIWTAHKSLSEVITLVDVVLKKPIKVLSESFTLVDTIRKAQSIVKAEVVVLVDTFSKLWTTTRTLGEVITLVDTVSKIKAAVKNLSESITLVDTIRRVTSRVLREALTLVDTVIKTIIFIRNLSETFILVDTLSQLRIYIRNLSENFTLVDTFSSIFDSIVSGLGRISRGFIRQVRDNFPPLIRNIGDSSGDVREARDSSGVIEQIKDNSSPKGVIIKDKDKPEIR